jgi:hypothetical protein
MNVVRHSALEETTIVGALQVVGTDVEGLVEEAPNSAWAKSHTRGFSSFGC